MISTTWKIAGAVVAVLALCALLVWVGYSWGTGVNEAAWQAKEAARVQSQKDALQAEVKRGSEFVTETIVQQLDQRDRYDQLEDKYAVLAKTVPLLVAPAAAQPGVVHPGLGAPAGAPGVAACEQQPAAGDRGAAVDARLTLAAVRMWNGALQGRDSAAGACGADASAADPEAACAADSGLSVEDAWTNHTWNARACAEDRLNHQRLIEFLRGRGALPAGAAP